MSHDTIELMPIAALMSLDVCNSLGRYPQSRAASWSKESKLMQGLNTASHNSASAPKMWVTHKISTVSPEC